MALVVLAGCSGSDKKKPSGDDDLPATAGPGEHDDDTCSIEGNVVDDEAQTVPGADVGLLEVLDVTTESAGDGSFAFSFLNPGVYNVAGSKAGYDPHIVRTNCAAGETATVELILEKIPDPVQAFYIIHQEQTGRIGCSFGLFSVSTQDMCKSAVGPVGPVDPNARNQFDFLPYQGDNVSITGAVFEMRWQQAGGFGGRNLALTYQHIEAQNFTISTEGTHNAAGNILAGPSPLRLRAESIDLNDPIYTLNNGTVHQFIVRAAGSTLEQLQANPADDGSSKLVMGQDFKFYVAYFYLGFPIPPNFTMLPEG